MHLPKFKLLRPETIPEAVHLLRTHGTGAQLIAGGTDLLPRMKYGVARPEVLISLSKWVPEKPTFDDKRGLVLDAFMTLAGVVRSQEVRQRAPSLVEAAHAVGSNQIRWMGTVGGNLCQESRCLYYNQTHSYQFVEPCFKRGGDHCYFLPKGTRCWAVFMSDTATALLSLGAQAIVTGVAADRTVPLDQFYSADPIVPLAVGADEIVSRVVIPAASNGQATAFKKFSLRGGLDYPVINVAVAVTMNGHGDECVDAKIALGAACAAPVRATKAEQILVGPPISEDLLRNASRVAASEVTIFPRDGFSVPYLRRCLEVHVADALTSALQRVPGRG